MVGDLRRDLRVEPYRERGVGQQRADVALAWGITLGTGGLAVAALAWVLVLRSMLGG